MKLRVGEIRYLNCIPVYSTLKKYADCRDYEFIPGEPAALNDMLARGEIDASSSSSVEYARHWGEYLIVPDISISSDGDVGSILLFSKVEVEGLSGRDIAVSSASATSTVLLKVLLRYHYRLEARLTPRPPVLGDMLRDAPAALLIGDEALREREAARGGGLRVYDLGGLWREFAGLPFVYALWMVREDSAMRDPGLLSRFKADLLASRDRALCGFPEMAAEAAGAVSMGADDVLSYWKAMSYGLDGRHIKGLKAFFRLAAELGEAPEDPPLRFL